MCGVELFILLHFLCVKLIISHLVENQRVQCLLGTVHVDPINEVDDERQQIGVLHDVMEGEGRDL